jgi:hypothetical protein
LPHPPTRRTAASILLEVEYPERVDLEFTHRQPGPLVLTVTPREASVGYRGHPPLQATSLPCPVESSLRVLRVGEFIEVFLDDRLVISTRAYADACQGITAHIDGAPATPLIQPVIPGGIERDDLSAVTRGMPPRLSAPAWRGRRKPDTLGLAREGAGPAALKEDLGTDRLLP